MLEWKPLPYFGRRWQKVKLIVVHWSGGYTLESAFQALKSRKVSYHYMVDGNTIWQLVDEKNAAYHAGSWLINQQSVGVAHIGIYESPVKEDSYATSGQLLAEICRRNGLEPNADTIKPHSAFKATACPGSCDLNRLIGEARKFYFGLTPEVTPTFPQEGENPVDNTYPKLVTATAKLRIRREANTQSEIIGFKQLNEIFEVVGHTEGETINNINKWYNTGSGYCWSGATK